MSRIPGKHGEGMNSTPDDYTNTCFSIGGNDLRCRGSYFTTSLEGVDQYLST